MTRPINGLRSRKVCPSVETYKMRFETRERFEGIETVCCGVAVNILYHVEG